MINTATIGKAYNEQPTTWRSICKIASVSNFLKHTVHRAAFVGDYERLVKAGAEPPHATYSESQTESRVDSWGLMIAFSRQDIINGEVGTFVDAARRSSAYHFPLYSIRNVTTSHGASGMSSRTSKRSSNGFER